MNNLDVEATKKNLQISFQLSKQSKYRAPCSNQS